METFDHIFNPSTIIFPQNVATIEKMASAILYDCDAQSVLEILQQTVHLTAGFQWDFPADYANCFHNFWVDPASSPQDCSTYYLWNCVAEDVLAAALVFFRHLLTPASHSLQTLCNDFGDEKADYGNFHRNLKYLPPTLRELLGISQPSTGQAYNISTHYPHLVAAIISNAKGSPLTSKEKTKNSYTMNRRTFQNCINAIRLEDTPVEEGLYFFERIFSFGIRFLLCNDFRIQKLHSKFVATLRQMPNVLMRYPLIKGLLVGFYNGAIDEDIVPTTMSLIGGHVFPSCLWIFCKALRQKYCNDVSAIIAAIEQAAIPRTEPISPLYSIDKNAGISRTERERYRLWFKSWNFDWDNSPGQIQTCLHGDPGAYTTDFGSMLLDSVLFDPAAIAPYLADYSAYLN